MALYDQVLTWVSLPGLTARSKAPRLAATGSPGPTRQMTARRTGRP